MKECPFIFTCEDSTSKSNFKSFCQARFPFSLIVSYKNCPTYKRMKVIQQGKKYLQKPQEWKKQNV